VKQKIPLHIAYNKNENIYEIGIDEAGRGPLFGRLYVAASVLPKDSSFRHEDMKDSKKFHSKKKIQQVAEYIKTHAIAWSVKYIEPEVIDQINIRQAVFKGMHECIREILCKLKNKLVRPMETDNINYINDIMLLVDGNDFIPFTVYDDDKEEIRAIQHETIEGGDNKYTAIAAASILAKVERDQYIADLCERYPELSSRYKIDTNMGYGTKAHLDGIVEHGITQWHRKTYGRCSGTPVNPL
jgi:ribonuclease HII